MSMNISSRYQSPADATRFSSAASTYDRHASVQVRVADELLQFMHDIPGAPHRLLDAGCGTGLLTERLCAAYPAARITAIDHAASMINVARDKHPVGAQVEWVVGDLLEHRAPAPYDCVVSSATLQWVDPLDAGLAHLTSLLTSGGYLAFAAMTEHTLNELHRVRNEIAPHKTPPRRLPSHETFCDAIRAAGLTLLRQTHANYTTEHVSSTALIRSLHEQGVTGGPVSRGVAPLTRSELARLATRYEELYRISSGHVRATYAVGYYLAQKGPSAS